jgi:DNA-binding beta-propeller fold protein YncE
MRRALSVLLALLSACSTPSASPDASDASADDAALDAPAIDAAPPLVCNAPATPSRLVVTADWMARTLTLLGIERVLDPGCTADDARIGTIDLAMWAPGPIQLRIAPDGRTAVVSVGPGFFTGSGGSLVGNPNPALDGALLIVDLVDRAVLAEIPIANAPMGIAISPDGQRAYVAEMGFSGAVGHQIAIVDLTTRTLVSEVSCGDAPEEIALSADGTIGALSVDGSSQVQVFQTSDVAGTLTAPFTCGNDSSGLAFVPGTSRFVITNSISSTYSIVDVANPAMPSIVASPRTGAIGPYGATWIPGTTDVLLVAGVPAALVRVSATDPMAMPERTPLDGGAFPLGVALTGDGRYALVAHPQRHLLSVVDRMTGTSHTLAMGTMPGPTYVAIQPAP